METQTAIDNNIESLEKQFAEHFSDTDKTVIVKSPASLTLLGDHTHYNDGLLIAAPLNTHTYLMMRKTKADSFKIVFNGTAVPLKNLKEYNPSKSTNYTYTIIKRIFQTLIFRDLIKGGVECVIVSEIPKSIGLGYYSSLQIGLFKAAKKVFRLKLSDLEMIEIAHKIEQEFIGQISNKANYFCSFFGKENCLMLVDLRENTHKCLKFNNDEFCFIVFDTNLTIKNSENICRTRIEECSVGVEALRLYIWGIKNLRDVNIEFLEKHINMTPQLVYKRCVYNVTEKQRVINAAKFIRTKKYNDFGNEIYDSFDSIVKHYELNYPELTKLVEETKNIPDIIAAKSISCTPAKCIYTIVKTANCQKIIRSMKKRFEISGSTNTKLTAYKFSTSNGAKFITDK
ncbi:MAG: hypothetical protein HND52_09260 [Ignavibacteriae bacterium]|nr:hypothetical protein [Ignavibacteriota bacterium]NOG98138.1 hypothetical protein [Ignavibacteriota bacterium]